MKRASCFLIAATLLAGSVQQAASAPATPAEASRLRAVFETYLGSGGTGGVSPVTITPRGEDYSVSIDVAQIARPLAALGFLMQAQPLSMTITPQSDGLWRVVQSAMPELQIRIKDQDMKLRFEGYSFDGLYDPRFLGFVLGKMGHAASIMESSTPHLLNTRRDGRTSAEMTGTGTGPGVMSAVMRGRNESHSQTFKILAGPNPIEIGVTTGAIVSEVTLDSLRNAGILDIWAFLVANPSVEALEARLEEIKTKVRATFPIFNFVAQRASVQTVAITTPVGAFGMRELGMAFNLTGVHRQGDFGMRMALSGISIPQLPMIPAWSRDLLPSDFVLDLKALGYDLEAAVEEILKVMRADVRPDESKAAGERAVYALAPPGKVKISMGPSQVVSKLLTITMEGDMTIIQPIPRGRLVMKARGIDETINALQNAAQSDKTAQQALMVLIGAKGFGKAEPDGSLTWVIENPDGGMPTINGVAIPGMGGR